MMTSPENYIKKEREKTLSEIRGIKKKIGEFKNLIEEEREDAEVLGEAIKALRIRLFEKRDKLNLLGGYKKSKRELMEEKLKEALKKTEKMVFTIGSFSGGYMIRTLKVKGDDVYLKIEHYPKKEEEKEEFFAFKKEEFFKKLDSLYLYEWKKSYTKKFYRMSDSDALWELEISLKKEKPINIYGESVFPHNFYELEELFKG